MITVLFNFSEVKYKTFTFSGGEEHVKIDMNTVPPIGSIHRVDVNALVQSSKDLMQLLLITDAIEGVLGANRKIVNMNLILPYIPYARQDRKMVDGESFSLKILSKIINSLNYDQVIVSDPHSDVSQALIENVVVVSQVDCFIDAKVPYDSDTLLISPDGGALKKIYKLSQRLNLDVITAEKIRDVSNGNIVATTVHGKVAGRKCLIVDDILDGGRTFIELAKVLKEKGASKIDLFVTHGIFSAGKEVFDGHIDNVYTSFDWTNNESNFKTKG